MNEKTRIDSVVSSGDEYNDDPGDNGTLSENMKAEKGFASVLSLSLGFI